MKYLSNRICCGILHNGIFTFNATIISSLHTVKSMTDTNLVILGLTMPEILLCKD